MKITKGLSAIAVILAICIFYTAVGNGEAVEPVVVTAEEPAEIEIIEEEPEERFTYYDVPLTDEQQEIIQTIAHENCVPYEIVLGVMYVESRFNADAVGDSGNSLGIMQIQPKWHTWRLEETGGSDWMDTVDNAKVGIHILSEKLQKYGRVEKALVVYNMGDNGARGIESTDYSKKVLEYAYSLY